MKFRVRKGLVLHMNDRPPLPGGTIVDLTLEQFERHAHQLEEIPAPPPAPPEEPKPTKRRSKETSS